MLIYIIIFFIALIAYIRTIPNGGLSKRAFGKFMLVLCLFVGLSDMLGGFDRYIYGELFDNIADIHRDNGQISSAYIFTIYPKEIGYIAWNWFVANFSANRYIFIFLTTGLMYFLFYYGMVQNARNLGLALLLFLGMFFFFSFTYLRQAIAVGLIWCSYKFIAEHKLLKFSLLVLLATGFHNSAIIFFPMFFLCSRLPSKNQIIFGAILVFVLGMTGIPSFLFEVYGSATSMEARSEIYINDFNNVRMEYLLEAVVFLCYLLNTYDQLPNDKTTVVCFNVALGFCALLLLFIKSLNGGRLSWPFLLGLICILSQKGHSDFSIRSLSLVSLSFILYFRIVILWGVLIYPYKTFLTSGFRDGDYIHNRYEYNAKYDTDKFCR